MGYGISTADYADHTDKNSGFKFLLQIGVGLGIGIGIEKHNERGKIEPFFWAAHSLPRRSPAKAGRRRKN